MKKKRLLSFLLWAVWTEDIARSDRVAEKKLDSRVWRPWVLSHSLKSFSPAITANLTYRVCPRVGIGVDEWSTSAETAVPCRQLFRSTVVLHFQVKKYPCKVKKVLDPVMFLSAISFVTQ